MTVYRFSPIWGQTWVGASESYITPDCNAATAQNHFNSIQSGRMSMLPNTAYVFGWRWGVFGGNFKSVVLRPPFSRFPPTNVKIGVIANGAQPVTASSGWPPLMNVSLQVNAQFGSSLPRFARKYIAGIPTNVIGGQPATYQPMGNTAWDKLLNNFLQYQVDNFFQIVGQNQESFPAAPIAGLTVQQAAPGLIGLQINTGSALNWQPGNRLAVQHLRPAKGTRNPTLNGQWTIDSVAFNNSAGQFTAYLRGSAGIDPTAQRTTAASRAFIVAQKLYPILELDGILVTGHKRGKVSGVPRGRRLSRPSLDP